MAAAISLPVLDHYVSAGAFSVRPAAGALPACMGRAGLTVRESITQAGTDALIGSSSATARSRPCCAPAGRAAGSR